MYTVKLELQHDNTKYPVNSQIDESQLDSTQLNSLVEAGVIAKVEVAQPVKVAKVVAASPVKKLNQPVAKKPETTVAPLVADETGTTSDSTDATMTGEGEDSTEEKPNVKWGLARLADYAAAHGVEVTDVDSARTMIEKIEAAQ